jgi:organic hydroperoxide reductase OsmC/OhrA
MAKAATYHTTVSWQGEHWGHVAMGNGPQMTFSAPPDAHGHAGVLTPEDAFVAAANTCIMMMFLWACERFKIDLAGYTCRGEGTKRIELDRTEIFAELRFWPEITVRVHGDATEIEKRVHRALAAAQKYSLVANSVKSEIIVEPRVAVIGDQ